MDSTYYYSLDTDVPYYFEFKGDQFVLYDWPSRDHQVFGIKVPVPGYPEYTAYKTAGPYTINEQGGFNILSVGDRSFIILKNDTIICVLLDVLGKTTFQPRVYWGINRTTLGSVSQRSVGLYTPEWNKQIKYSTGQTVYSRSSVALGPPFDLHRYRGLWMTNATSDGKGQWIEIATNSDSDKIVVLNGLILPDNLGAFNYVNRAKTIQVNAEGFQQIVELADTPNPQVIRLKKVLTNSGIIRLTVIDVYHGSSSTDVALSFIGFLSSSLLF
jgi:hypothetical protein